MNILAVGDIFLETKNKREPFEFVKSLFLNKDVIFGNLETTLLHDGRPIEKRVTLKAEPKKINFLAEAGFNVLNIANNHILDYRIKGYQNTLQILKDFGISYIGARDSNKCIISTDDGTVIGLIGYSYGNPEFLATINLESIRTDISKLKKEVNIIVVSLHWGVEYVLYPMPEQQRLAREIIDNGAHIILGHHPHIVQGIEEYDGGLIVYSLGNFQFGVDCDRIFKYTDKGLAINIKVSKDGIEDYELIPIKINEAYQPTMMQGSDGQEFLSFIAQISEPLQGKEISEEHWFEESSEIFLKSQMEAWLYRIRKYGIRHLYLFFKTATSKFYRQAYSGLIRRYRC